MDLKEEIFALFKADDNKELEEECKKFLKTAEIEKNNKYCDLNKYELYSKRVLLLNSLSNNKKETVKEDVQMEIECNDDAPVNKSFLEETKNTDQTLLTITDNDMVNEVACAIKEQLTTANSINDSLLKHLNNLSEHESKQLFSLLSENASTDIVVYMGNTNFSIQDKVKNYYCHFLLIPQIKTTFSKDLLKLFNKYFETINCELVEILHEGASRTLTQYIKDLDNEMKSKLLKQYILKCNTLDSSNLNLIENLLENQLEHEVLDKLLKLLLDVPEELNKSGKLGKLLFKLLKLVDRNLVHFERSFRIIINAHRSMWKTKVEKAFNDYYKNTAMLSQNNSLMY